MSSTKKKIIIFSILGAVILIAVLFAVFGKKDKGIVVTAEPVTKKDITQIVTASGKIYPEIEVKISPDVSGEVIELAVTEGQEVKKGQFLARIKPDFYKFQMAQSEAGLTAAESQANSAKSQFDKARQEYQRVKEMFAKKLVSDSELEAAKTSFEVAEQTNLAAQADIKRSRATVDQAQESLNKTSLYSPIDGIISSLLVEKGERVVGTSQFAGTEIMRIADFSKMEIRVDVNENDVVNVTLGDTARISVDAFKGKTFNGIVTEIAHTPVTSGLGTQEEVTNFPVKIKILNPSKEFRSGLSATADIETDRVNQVLAVPIQAVTIRKEIKSSDSEPKEESAEKKAEKPMKDPPKIIFISDNGLAKSVEVTTGISDDRFIEIKTGLTGTESVITGSYRAISRELNDKSKIQVEDPKKKPADSGEKE
ncbi:MAG: efflux RND transporter periplasmic adaptor subunit [Bacteroidetes bacterium]|nr:efflux RND transporter periplasmic adaptor subunit [Bacteroidota bacterium]